MKSLEQIKEDTIKSKKYYSGLDNEDKVKRKEQFKKQAKKSDSLSTSYKDAPGDEDARKGGKLKKSKHTIKYNKIHKSKSINEKSSELNKGEIDDDKIEKALKTKSEETGVSIEILRVIMRRGMAAWKSGHRPGATQQQWGYARTNSFLTKGSGTWGDADKDMADEVKKRGQDKKLKS